MAGLSTEHFLAEAAHHLPAAQASELGISRSYYVCAAPPAAPPLAGDGAEASSEERRRSEHAQQPITLQAVKGLVAHPLQSTNQAPAPAPALA